MNLFKCAYGALLLAFSIFSPVFGQLNFGGGAESESELILSEGVPVGGEGAIYLHLKHPEGWSSYYCRQSWTFESNTKMLSKRKTAHG